MSNPKRLRGINFYPSFPITGTRVRIINVEMGEAAVLKSAAALKGGTRIGIAGANLVRVPADLTTSRFTTVEDGFGSSIKLKFQEFFYQSAKRPPQFHISK